MRKRENARPAETFEANVERERSGISDRQMAARTDRR
jgi:hypothetical protein